MLPLRHLQAPVPCALCCLPQLPTLLPPPSPPPVCSRPGLPAGPPHSLHLHGGPFTVSLAIVPSPTSLGTAVPEATTRHAHHHGCIWGLAPSSSLLRPPIFSLLILPGSRWELLVSRLLCVAGGPSLTHLGHGCDLLSPHHDFMSWLCSLLLPGSHPPCPFGFSGALWWWGPLG